MRGWIWSSAPDMLYQGHARCSHPGLRFADQRDSSAGGHAATPSCRAPASSRTATLLRATARLLRPEALLRRAARLLLLRRAPLLLLSRATGFPRGAGSSRRGAAHGA